MGRPLSAWLLALSAMASGCAFATKRDPVLVEFPHIGIRFKIHGSQREVAESCRTIGGTNDYGQSQDDRWVEPCSYMDHPKGGKVAVGSCARERWESIAGCALCPKDSNEMPRVTISEWSRLETILHELCHVEACRKMRGMQFQSEDARKRWRKREARKCSDRF